jgi:DNA-directed RNA polymerase subunit RPC12/RpoP
MHSHTTRCGACGQNAVIHKVRYKYSVEGPPGQLADKHVLRETERDIECPHCGFRTDIEVYGFEASDASDGSSN